MKTRNMKISAVEETTYGLYVWETEGGAWIMDEDRNVMNIESEKGDATKIAAITEAAHRYMREAGVEPNGRPLFLAGNRRITDEQYEEQKARQAAGLTPDPFDVGAMEDDLKEAIHDGGKIR